ncbi:MAG: hypothetical protein WC889_14065, partial [Myxococcota bacterium]
MSGSRFTFLWITLAAVAIIGGSRVGCNGETGKDAGSFDSGLRPDASDAGVDAGSTDSGPDASLDSGTDAGPRDTDVNIDGNYIYDYKAPDVENPMG